MQVSVIVVFTNLLPFFYFPEVTVKKQSSVSLENLTLKE